MPRPTPGEAVPSVSEAARKSWYAFKHFNAGSSQDPYLSYLSGYQRAVADMLVDQFQFRGLDDLLERVLATFDYLAREREAVRQTSEEIAP
jgi:hypothetical protein